VHLLTGPAVVLYDLIQLKHAPHLSRRDIQGCSRGAAHRILQRKQSAGLRARLAAVLNTNAVKCPVGAQVCIRNRHGHNAQS
jgi:hypothetical protein